MSKSKSSNGNFVDKKKYSISIGNRQTSVGFQKSSLINSNKPLLNIKKYSDFDSDILDLETKRLIHDLKKHQRDLEIQNKELRSLQDDLKTSRDKYSDLYEFAPVGYFTVDLNGLIVDVNNRGAKQLGYLRQFLVKRPFIIFIINEDRDKFYGYLNNIIIKKKHETCEIRLKRKDNLNLIVQLNGVLAEDCNGESYIKTTSSDITFQKKAEVERDKVRNQFLHAQRMESIGFLAAGFAHEFNSLMTVINNNTYIVKTCLQKNGNLVKNLEKIFNVVKYAKNLTHQLLRFSETNTENFELIDLKEIVYNMVDILGSLLGNEIKIVTHLESGKFLINGNRTNIEQILMNLSINAKEAMSPGGVLTIKVGKSLKDDRKTKYNSFNSKNNKLTYLQVSDSGKGINKKSVSNIFDPFYTTKEVGKGVGLGLSVVYGIVKEHKGWIDVITEVKQGTVFKLYFPQGNS